jgi:hypothetical protein
MDLIQQKFVSVFSAYQVDTQARPDGGVLLTLRAADGGYPPRADLRATAQCRTAVLGDQCHPP